MKLMKYVKYIIIAIILIAGIIMTCVKGFNVDLIYKAHNQVNIYIGKEFNENDIKQIAKEVINDRVIVQKVEVYEEIASIIAKKITLEQLEEINAKINEKYEVENKVEDLTIKENGRVRLLDIIKPYIWPVAIAVALTIAYVAILSLIYKFKMLKAIANVLFSSIVIEGLYFSIIAILRLPVCSLTIPIAIIIWFITLIVIFTKLAKKIETTGKENKKKTK